MTSILPLAAALLVAQAPAPHAMSAHGAAGAPASTGPSMTLEPAARAALAGEARRLKLDQEPATAATLRDLQADAAVGQLLADQTPAPTDAQVKEAFHARSDQVRLQAVLVPTREEAAAVRARLEAGGSLIEEARKSFEPMVKAKAGELGWVARYALPPAVAAAAFAAKPNALAGPLEVPGGFAAIRVLELKVADESGLAAARPGLEAWLRDQSALKAREQLLAQLKARAKVTIDEPFIGQAADRAATDADRKRPVATIGGRPLTFGEVAEAAGPTPAHPVGGGTGLTPRARALLAAASALVDQRLLEQEAARVGAGKKPEAQRAVAQNTEEVLVAAYYDAVARSVPAPTEAELAAEYQRHPPQPPRPLAEVKGDLAASMKMARAVERIKRRAVELLSGQGK